MSKDHTVDAQTSGTAMATAFLRALAACDPRTDLRGSDDLAGIFLDDEHKKPLTDPKARAWVIQNRIAPGAYEFMLARTAFFDEIVSRALQEDTAQILFLGAGYDSRPYRFSGSIRKTRIFELDAAPTQARKRECLQAAGLSIPEQIRYVPINFEADDLAAKLANAGYSPEKEGLFIWEGVTYYLSAAAVDNMLGFVSTHAARGSSIAFDYAALSDQALNEAGAGALRDHLRSKYSGEPIKFGIQAGKIGEFLVERGFKVARHLSAREMTQAYLGSSRHPDMNPIPSLLCLVQAKTI